MDKSGETISGPATTGASVGPMEAHLELVKRILASSHFRSSPRLSEFFRYVADASLRDAPEELTEQQIGIRVFGRKAGYNCSEDSVVRSQARQLRLKLDAYFASEGVDDIITIDIPKGHYVLQFRPRISDAAETPKDGLSSVTAADGIHEQIGESDVQPRRGIRRPHVRKVFIIPALFISGLIFWWAFSWNRADNSQSLAKLWGPFFSGNVPIVVFSNPVFTGNPSADLHYRSASDPGTSPIIDTYTGVGEVAAVHALDLLFASHGKGFRLERSHLLSWDEARAGNLIFVGSPGENTSLREIPTTSEFTFARPDELPPGFNGVVNHHPRAGQPSLYLRPDQFPLSEDFAIIALLNGPGEKQWFLLLSGLSTYGTQAAVEYATSPEGANRIMRLLGDPKTLHPFEALLHVRVGGGVPLEEDLVAVRPH